ncbi:Galactose oxidase/kelch repeat superfamily protein [Actinidia rufa]|uniref:Galactose oxidase/kelch repeat superfamily protein n=1 Tax=Actinidia rufa TaxID=165716 RepID=A0A7J0GRN9_9ERIC|nr:Galactose oxidase/kelch repeat superfamily protein [Actinidia rufa]
MDEPKSTKEPNSQSHPFAWDYLGPDLTELILSHLPIRSIVRSAAICKLWHSIVTGPAFARRVSAAKKPWFFLYGQNNIFSKNNQAFAFDPEADEWIKLPISLFPFPSSQEESFVGSGGFFFTTTSSRFQLRAHPRRRVAPNRPASILPMFIGGLVDIEDRLAVEIYNPNSDSWDLCPPLPADFRSGNSSQWLSSALFRGKFYVFGINSFFVSAFDLNNHIWSEVQTLRPPGVLFSFLIACQDQLVLAGLCNSPPRGPSFNLWKIDEKTMEFSEIAIMPQELLYYLLDSDEDDKLASLKCVGLGNLIYVFIEEHHRNYPACVCEISSGKCSWRRVPNLMVPGNRFHKVISFCSTIPLANILRGAGEEFGPGQAIH